MYLVIAEIVNALGGYKEVAAICLVSTANVNKWKDNPGGSGQTIPVERLQELLAAAGQRLTNLTLQNLIDELINEHFLNLCFRRGILEDRIFEIVEILQNGTKPKAVNS